MAILALTHIEKYFLVRVLFGIKHVIALLAKLDANKLHPMVMVMLDYIVIVMAIVIFIVRAVY